MNYFSYKNLAALSFMAAIIFFISSHYLDSQQKKMSVTVLEQIRLQEAKTYELAQSVKNSKLTPSLSLFVNDCSTKHRNQFDTNLDKLGTLTATQIENLEPLFDACADYFANVKTALVIELENEITELETLLSIADVSDQSDILLVPLDSWKSYLDLEKKLAEALRKQVSSQASIISLLKGGKSGSDPQVQTLVNEARQLSETASVTTKQLDAIYLTLVP